MTERGAEQRPTEEAKNSTRTGDWTANMAGAGELSLEYKRKEEGKLCGGKNKRSLSEGRVG